MEIFNSWPVSVVAITACSILIPVFLPTFSIPLPINSPQSSGTIPSLRTVYAGQAIHRRDLVSPVAVGCSNSPDFV